MIKLIIVGAGGFGREVLSWASNSVDCDRQWRVHGFIDDNIDALGSGYCGYKILGKIVDHNPKDDEVFACALGMPRNKIKCCNALLDKGARFAQIVHRTAVIADGAKLGDGVIMCPFSVASAGARIGRFVTLNLHSTVDHDAAVGDFSQISCHCDITAAAQIGRAVFFGSRVSVLPGLSVGEGACIGAGAVVTRDIPAYAKAYGVPARVMGRAA